MCFCSCYIIKFIPFLPAYGLLKVTHQFDVNVGLFIHITSTHVHRVVMYALYRVAVMNEGYSLIFPCRLYKLGHFLKLLVHFLLPTCGIVVIAVLAFPVPIEK